MENGFTIHFDWRSVMAAKDAAYYFPQKFTSFMRERYCVPAVYRWKVLRTQAQGSKESVYIGQGEDLLRRMSGVLARQSQPKKGNTNKRLHDIFCKYVEDGRSIVMEIADVDPFEVSGVRFGRDTMGNTFKRRAIENLLLTITQQSVEKQPDVLE